ncbi:putative DNA polymerase delta small subunit [Aphelenchoides besseyi]|nr:putative DNA polymerase delta small subunit [Aphelenchoides besseyi]KAI6193030.1 putative DNA polymerase delta small subunit [Aphelenchoides besseyi]
MEYQDTNERFYITADDYSPNFGKEQFYRHYCLRYRMFQQLCLKEARKVYGPNLINKSLSHVKPGIPTYLDGVFVKVSPNRPSVFKEFPVRWKVPIVDDPNLMVYDPRSEASPRDTIWIENNMQRLELRGDVIITDKIVGGYVVGLYGRKTADCFGFNVERMFFPELAPQVPWPIVEHDVYLMFISGIGMTSEVEKNTDIFASFSHLVEWLKGEDGQKISRDLKRGQLTKRGLIRTLDTQTINQADRALEDIAKVVKVDLMSGATDICPIMLPQQPMVRRMFERCKNLENFRTLTNPHSFTVNGIRFLGTSGQNLDDMHKRTRACTSVQLMMQTIRGRIMTPTLPNSVDGWPFENRDPQILDEIPHVYFAGNQPDYLSRMVEFKNGARTLLLTIPVFREKFQAVVMNVRSMRTQLFNFDQSLL